MPGLAPSVMLAAICRPPSPWSAKVAHLQRRDGEPGSRGCDVCGVRDRTRGSGVSPISQPEEPAMKLATCLFATALILPGLAVAQTRNSGARAGSVGICAGPPREGAGRRERLRTRPADAEEGREGSAGRIRLRAGASAEQGCEAITSIRLERSGAAVPPARRFFVGVLLRLRRQLADELGKLLFGPGARRLGADIAVFADAERELRDVAAVVRLQDRDEIVIAGRQIRRLDRDAALFGVIARGFQPLQPGRRGAPRVRFATRTLLFHHYTDVLPHISPRWPDHVDGDPVGALVAALRR